MSSDDPGASGAGDGLEQPPAAPSSGSAEPAGASGAGQGVEQSSAAPSSGSDEPTPSAGSSIGPGAEAVAETPEPDATPGAPAVAETPVSQEGPVAETPVTPERAEEPGAAEPVVEEPVAGVDADVAEPESAEPMEAEPAPPSAQSVLLEELTSVLGDRIVGSEELRGDLWVRVRADSWRAAAEACKSIGFDYFCFLSGIDWMPSTSPNPKLGVGAVDVGDEGSDEAIAAVAEEETAQEENAERRAAAAAAGEAGVFETGHAGCDTRFQVFARLYSIRRHLGVTLKADLDDEAPSVATWSDIYAGADWHEREAWEMYGFDFVGHPGLIHLYLPGEFEGFPMRKDFPLLSREVKPWPGLVDVEPMPEGPESEAEATAEAEA